MTVLNLAVSASADDAYQADGQATISGGLTQTTGGIGTGTTTNVPKRMLGARFTTVTIANAATINTATLKFPDNGVWTQITFHWFGHAADNTTTFTSGEDMSARTRTTASVACSENINRTAGTYYGYPNTGGNMSTIIQEIVNRAGWASGNALAVIAYGDGGSNNASGTIRTWDFSANPGATLVIDYTAASQDTPELYGRPDGLRGQRQIHQLLAT